MIRRAWRSTFGLAAIVSLAFAFATLAVGAIVYEVAHEALEQQLDHRVALETRALLGVHRQGGLAGLAIVIRQRDAARNSASLGYILTDARHRRIAGDLAADVPHKPGYWEFLPHGLHREREAQALTMPLPGGGTLVVAADRAMVHEIDETILHLFAVAFGVMLVLGVGSAWTIGTITRRRLDRFAGAADAINAGDLGRRMRADGSGSEFDRLATALNAMLDRMVMLVDNLRHVSGDIAHDLRTPLTRLQNRLEEALAMEGQGDQRAAIEGAVAQGRELLEIFAAMLRISEIEALRVREGFRPVDLSALCEAMIETYQPDAEAGGHQMTARIAPGLMLEGDRRLLQQMLANLLDNALRHTPAGTQVTVTLSRVEDTLALLVEDDGPGVPPEDVPRLFQRFSRSERSRSTEGYGLGLALVAAIATAHRGTASVGRHEGGLTIRITLGTGDR
ncbi:HAMP domain-containing sensor histidine kinase [Sphingomonas naphthae]|uniref:histidine kinase n=1 Tax=Sphingomonas naphthae TaxID=1813468 RepID=A0ABY7TJE0_9SPHN|nr:HAMP domain-containing sensor histidine kinase [Sphingomonas naphthae]WCT73071.1 HAMP domain-containing sensor histidine kinase [Sphingomonas naphthae]